jgi:MFS family permease
MLAALGLALILSMTTWFSATAVIPQLKAQWGLSDTLSAWLTIAVQVGFVIGAVGMSALNLSDIIPTRVLIVFGSVGAAAANAGILLADQPGVVLGLRLATGFCLAGVYPPALKLIATWFSRGRGLALGVLVGALTAGSAAPHLVNALGGLRWQVVIASTTLATLSGALVVALVVREGPYRFPRARFSPAQTGRVFHNRAVVLASLGYFGHMWELYAMWAWFLYFARQALAEQHITGEQAAPLLTFVVIAAGGLGCVLGGILGDRWGRPQAAGLMMAVSGSCALLSGLVYGGPIWLFVAVSLVWGISVVADSAQFSAMVTDLGDPRYVGTALTLQMGVGFCLTVATIWILPLLAGALQSWQWVFLILVPGPALGILAMLGLRRPRRPFA